MLRKRSEREPMSGSETASVNRAMVAGAVLSRRMPVVSNGRIILGWL